MGFLVSLLKVDEGALVRCPVKRFWCVEVAVEMDEFPLELASRQIRGELNPFVEMNRLELGEGSDRLNWVTAEAAEAFHRTRNDLLGEMSGDLQWSCLGTKPHVGPLSPGCAACAAGTWSCLFVNELCNCRCFYCPTTQTSRSVPMTQTVPFERYRDYAEYVQRFGYQGVSISGGEPFLSFETSLAFLRTVDERMAGSAHLWLYTNGSLVTLEKLRELKQAGLKEIRFDISARDYQLDTLSLAAHVMDGVTVEIPAIPEDRDRLMNLLPELCRLGVSHLNLHQLRVTPHNMVHMESRGYTVSHAEHPVVIESELTALEILRHVLRERLPLAVNYCAFAYKYRFQRAAARGKCAPFVLKPYQSVTQTGHIRTLSVSADGEAMEAATRLLEREGTDPALWARHPTGAPGLLLHPSLVETFHGYPVRLTIRYDFAAVLPRLSYRLPFTSIKLESGKEIFVERMPACQTRAWDEATSVAALAWLSREDDDARWNVLPESLRSEIQPFERQSHGLARYD